LIVAEGLLMYLTKSEVRDLLQRLTDRFSTGELLADLLSQWAGRISKISNWFDEWGTKDGHELCEWNPRLSLVDTSVFLDPKKIPLQPQRLAYQLTCAIPAIRNYDRLYRFRF
jgi:O-methyltransferase involved in polyketide biosynthesis